MNLISRDLMDQVEMSKHEQDFSWTDASCALAQCRITLGNIMAYQEEFERNVEQLLEDATTERLNRMIEEELK